MLILTNVGGSSPDKLQVTTSAAVTVDVHTSWLDNSSGVITPGRTNSAISTATTTDVVAAPASGVVRNVRFIAARNRSASSSVDVTVTYNANGTTYELYKVTLLAGQTLEYKESLGFYVVGGALATVSNYSSADQSVGASVTNYLNNSNLLFPSTQPLQAGTILRWTVVASKTAAGTAAYTFDVRFGTAATTSDTSRLTFTGPVSTAVIDVARYDIECTVRSAGASGVVQGSLSATKNAGATAGFFNVPTLGISTTSAGFDTTTANLYAGLSLTTGASASVTVTQVVASAVFP